MSSERLDPVLTPRPASAFLLLPVLAIPAVFAAWGLFLWTGLGGRPATGAVVTLRATACPEAGPLLASRSADMGLPGAWQPTSDGFALATTLPVDAIAAAEVPRTLALPGALTVRGPDGAALLRNDGLRSAEVRLDVTLSAGALLRLTDAADAAVTEAVLAAPDGRLTFQIDGADVGIQLAREVTHGELEIWLTDGTDRDRMNRVAAWGVALDHGPLPCAVQIEVGAE